MQHVVCTGTICKKKWLSMYLLAVLGLQAIVSSKIYTGVYSCHLFRYGGLGKDPMQKWLTF